MESARRLLVIAICVHVCVCKTVSERVSESEREREKKEGGRAREAPYLGCPEGTSFHGGISRSPHGRVELHSR